MGMKIVVAGGTGQIGTMLCRYLSDKGHTVVQISREPGANRVVWDGKSVGEWAKSLEGADAVINLSGAGILKRWTAAYWKQIEESRLLSTAAIGAAVAQCQTPPKVWINASAIGFYGEPGDREVVEASRSGTDKLATLCKEWEDACLMSRTPETRKVCLRIGVVIGPEPRIMKMMSSAAKLGLCVPLGSGQQYISWIHWNDLMRMFEWCLFEPVTGAVNATAPNPVTQTELCAAMRGIYFRPPLPNVPVPMVRLFAAVMGLEADMLMTGQRVYPEIALVRGFRFDFEQIEPSLKDVLDASPKAWQPA